MTAEGAKRQPKPDFLRCGATMSFPPRFPEEQRTERIRNEN